MAAPIETTSEFSLIIENGKYFTEIPNKKGEKIKRPIQDSMIGFDKSLAQNGDAILVTMKNGVIQPKSVKLKGHEDYTPPESDTSRNSQRYTGRSYGGSNPSNYGRNSHGHNQNQITSKLESPSNIGLEFHNPYTFIPFSGTPQHFEPTIRTVDEVEKDRLSGVLEISVQTLRPLLTSQAVKNSKDQKEKHSAALKIGPDIIVPATAIRGMLRNLMMILTSGSLGNTNPNAWFCCGRDVQLGDGTGRTPQTPRNLFLAKVERAGNAFQDGLVRIGKCQLVPLEDLERVWPGNLRNNYKDTKGKVYFTFENGTHRPFDERRDAGKTRWQLKLSGKIPPIKDGILDPEDGFHAPFRIPLWELCGPFGTIQDLRTAYRNSSKTIYLTEDWNEKKKIYRLYDEKKDRNKNRFKLTIPLKKEALYTEDLTQPAISVPSSLWADYISRNTNGVHTELKQGDLIWLEPQNPNLTRITDGSQIKSLQWARWGKRGQSIQSVLPGDAYLPDTRRTDRKVDIVTDLFGQASDTGDKNVPCFAGRIRPENLVFRDTSARVWKQIPLVALSAPHPGCFSFYQKKDEPKLRGYKVYRAALDSEKPWEYDEQPIYDNNGNVRTFGSSDMMRAADLLPPKQTGKLRIAFQALTANELALLCRACSVSAWRLGGGKPIGLGLCRPEITSVFIFEDDGTIRTVQPSEFQLDEPLRKTVEKQTAIWEATQKPVAKVRYPRAALRNHDSFQRGGHVWFSVFAAPKKGASGQMERELQAVRFTPAFRTAKRFPANSEAMEAQWLPPFDPNHPEADVLYGWNAKLDPKITNKVKSFDSFEPFEEKHDALPADTVHVHGNDSQNRATRLEEKSQRLNTEE